MIIIAKVVNVCDLVFQIENRNEIPMGHIHKSAEVDELRIVVEVSADSSVVSGRKPRLDLLIGFFPRLLKFIILLQRFKFSEVEHVVC